MSSSARRIRTSPYHWKEHQKEDSAAPAAGSFAHGGKGTKTPFWGVAPSACSLNRRAKPEWPTPLLPGHWALARRKFGLGVSTWSAWFVPCCLAGPRMRADETSAPTRVRELFRRGRCPHRPAETPKVLDVGADVPIRPSEPASTAGGNRRAFFVQPAGRSSKIQPATAARKRGQSTAPPAPALWYSFPGSVPRNGGPGAGDWSAGTPRSPAPGNLWFFLLLERTPHPGQSLRF